ncbi:MAG: T9SS type A sorting domain-containing protein, partial [Bacteroidota bacterium]
QTLTVTLMPDGQGGGMAEIWATDFIAYVEDCFGNVIDKYAIYRESDPPAGSPSATQIGIDFDCDDVDQDIPVRVYAIADNGTADYCSVIVEVQAFQDGVCEDGTGNILSGAISTTSNEAVEGVSVSITGSGNMDETVVTDRNGVFGFSVVSGGDYTVQPRFDVDVNLSHVSTTDIVAITGQILGTNAFTNSYNFLAADVNFDQRIDVLDIVSIRRTILGLEDNFGHGQTWSFVPVDVDVSNPFAETFPNVYNVNDLVGNVLDADFVAIETGEIKLTGRTAATLEVEDVQLAAGQSHTMVIAAEELAGFQGTFELAAGLELVSADLEGEGAMNLNRAAEGLVAVAAGEATLTLEVRATEAGLLSNYVSLTDAITTREGVAQNGNGGALSLNFSGLAVADVANRLEQNMPNPVVNETQINFSLATAGEVTLNVQDVQGRTVLVRNLDGVAGNNQVIVNVSELKGATGVLSYTLVAGDFSATKKMVVVR